VGDVKPFRFYSGHIGREFGRNELLPPEKQWICAETRYNRVPCECIPLGYMRDSPAPVLHKHDAEVR
jgi:hypothetical protein